VVQVGDTLAQIARDNNTTIEQIMRVNGLPNSGFIYVGQMLRSGDPANGQGHVPQAIDPERPDALARGLARDLVIITISGCALRAGTLGVAGHAVAVDGRWRMSDPSATMWATGEGTAQDAATLLPRMDRGRSSPKEVG